MSKIKWDVSGERFFETGVDHGVLFPMNDDGTYAKGVAWNGLTAVTESPEGGEPTALYADNIKYLEMMSNEDYKATIEAYMYPPEFYPCDGYSAPVKGLSIGQQTRKKFGLVYRTKVGNDVVGDAKGYKLHLVWGLMASPSEKAYETVNDTPNAITFSWEVSSTPVETEIKGLPLKPISTLSFDTTTLSEADQAKLTALETILFGTDPVEGEVPVEGTDPTLPDPATVIKMFYTEPTT